MRMRTALTGTMAAAALSLGALGAVPAAATVPAKTGVAGTWTVTGGSVCASGCTVTLHYVKHDKHALLGPKGSGYAGGVDGRSMTIAYSAASSAASWECSGILHQHKTVLQGAIVTGTGARSHCHAVRS